MMRKLNIHVFITAIILVACSGNDSIKDNKATEILSENIVIADYAIDGMVCAVGCAKTIQEELSEMNGVAVCEVNYEEGKAHIEYDKTQLTENDIKTLIEGLADGQYKVSEWVEKSKINGEVEEGEEGSEEITEVALPDFEIPNLFSLLFNQL